MKHAGVQALNSEHIDPHKLLTLLPAHGLPHLRAILLERLGRHQEALRCSCLRLQLLLALSALRSVTSNLLPELSTCVCFLACLAARLESDNA